MFSSCINDLHYGLLSHNNFIEQLKDSKHYLKKFNLVENIKAHNGCVNAISWNDDGSFIISGSDDLSLVISDGFTYHPLYVIKTHHCSNIFSVKFFPGSLNSKIVTCAGDGKIIVIKIHEDILPYHKLKTLKDQLPLNILDCDQLIFTCHHGTVYEVLPLPDINNTFISCGEDGTVRYYDLTVKSTCVQEFCKENVFIDCGQPISCITVDPIDTYKIVCGCLDGSVRMFDGRKLLNEEDFANSDGYCKSGISSFDRSLACMYGYFKPINLKGVHRITSLAIDPYNNEIIVSYSGDNIYLFNTLEYYQEPSIEDNPLLASTKTASGGLKKKFKNDDKNTVLTENEHLDDGNAAGEGLSDSTIHIRFRGDWSDTGPLATPESVNRRPHTNITSGELRPPTPTPDFPPVNNNLHDDREEINENTGETIFNPDNETGNNRMDTDMRRPPPSNRLGEVLIKQMTDMLNSYLTRKRRASLATAASTNPHPCKAPEALNSPPPVDDKLTNSSPRNDPSSPFTTDFSNHGGPTTSSSKDDSLNNVNLYDSGRLTIISKLSPQPIYYQNITKLPNSTEELNLNDNMEMVEDDNRVSEASLETTFKKQTTSHQQDDTESNHTIESETSGEHDQPSAYECMNAHKKKVGLSSELLKTKNIIAVKSINNNNRLMAALGQENIEDNHVSPKERSGDQQFDRCKRYKTKMSYKGHRNSRTMIKECNFWANSYVVSGSDCGHIFFWDRKTGEIVNILEADRHVVNCIQPHPIQIVLASSGIDYDIKIWSICPPPTIDNNAFQKSVLSKCDIEELVKRNEIMTRETRNIVTIPASFMIRMLAHMRRNLRTEGLDDPTTTATQHHNTNSEQNGQHQQSVSTPEVLENSSDEHLR